MPKRDPSNEFDPEKFAAALATIKTTPRPPRKMTADATIKASAADIRELIKEGMTYAEIATAFTNLGVKMSAATLQKALSRRKPKPPKPPKTNTHDSTTKPATSTP